MNASTRPKAANRMIVVLLERGYCSNASVTQWLAEGGFRAWEANDICHAFEELSDFTVKMRPDAVVLDVSSLDESFDDLSSAFQLMSEKDAITVLGLCDGKSSVANRPSVAGNLSQLKKIINKEVRKYPSAVC